jgi:hypothetical protein
MHIKYDKQSEDEFYNKIHPYGQTKLAKQLQTLERGIACDGEIEVVYYIKTSDVRKLVKSIIKTKNKQLAYYKRCARMD